MVFEIFFAKKLLKNGVSGSNSSQFLEKGHQNSGFWRKTSIFWPKIAIITSVPGGVAQSTSHPPEE
jgi:hypothetical protein